MMSVLDVLTVPYELAVRTRHWFYRHGWLATRGLPCPVMSVGNVTVGGTGKTPFVIWLARQLQARGHRLGVLSRGYRRTSQAACLLVSDGREVLVEPQEAGDEPFLIAQRCPGVLVAVGTNRYEVGKWVLDRYPVDAFLLDDGFQHVALARDIDLVLVDTSDPGRWRRLLPIGTLREPLTALSRATAIVLTRATPSLPYEALLDELFQAAACRLPVIVTEFYPSQLLHVSTGAFAPLSRGEQRTSMLVSGIGNPLSFRTVVSQIGTLIRGELIFPDHHAYTKQDLLMIRRQLQSCQADMVLTTEKDAVKLRRYVDETDPIWAVRIETRILKGQEELETLFNQLDRLIWTR